MKYGFNLLQIFILLSKIELPHFEGFGIVNLEAIKFGLPIIISKESNCPRTHSLHLGGHRRRAVCRAVLLVGRSVVEWVGQSS